MIYYVLMSVGDYVERVGSNRAYTVANWPNDSDRIRVRMWGSV